LQVSGVDLSSKRGIYELHAFQRKLSQYRMVVYSGLRYDSIMFDGQVASPVLRRVPLSRHHETDGGHDQRIRVSCIEQGVQERRAGQVRHVLRCLRGNSPCIQGDARIPCDGCNRHFRNATCLLSQTRPRVAIGYRTYSTILDHARHKLHEHLIRAHPEPRVRPAVLRGVRIRA
jgi:hypothetical protein